LASERGQALEFLDFLKAVLDTLKGQREGTSRDAAHDQGGMRHTEGRGTDHEQRRKAGRKSGGKPSLEKSNPRQFQVYQRIQQEHRRDEEYLKAVERLKNDKDFIEQVQHIGLRLDTKLVRKALSYFDTKRGRDGARNKQQTDEG
jgi:hypothetical protein